jgi:hypothetical protein
MRARPFAAYAADLQQNATGSGSAIGGPRYIRCSVYFAAPEPEKSSQPIGLLRYFDRRHRHRNSELTAANSKITAAEPRAASAVVEVLASGGEWSCTLFVLRNGEFKNTAAQ